MERPSRRSTTQNSSNGHAPANNGSDSSARHRRRREASGNSSSNNMSASQSDGGAETDSSSIGAAHDSGSSGVTRSSKKLLQRDAKKRRAVQRGENPAAHDDRHDGDEEEVDGDDEHEEEDDDHDLSSSESHATTSSGGGGGGGGSIGSVGKRERSLSNVSTTSSSSSIASDHDEEGRLVLQLEKLKELETKKKMVEDGTLAEFCRRVTEFKEERNQLLETAEWHKSLQLKNSEDLYGFEVQRAHNLWQQAKDSLKSKMLAHVDSLVAKLKQELDALATAEASHDAQTAQTAVGATGGESLSSSAPPSDSTEPEDASSEKDEEREAQEENVKTKAPASSKRRKVADIELPEQTVRLPLDDINSDLASILGERKQRAEASAARLSKKAIDNFKCERRRLFCGKYILEDGDEVVVSSPVIKEDYIGTISSVTEDAVYIKLSSGQKVRIYLELIEHKRCEVKPFLRGSAGMGSLQATGWAECEPF